MALPSFIKKLSGGTDSNNPAVLKKHYFQYPSAYCPYCYHLMPERTVFFCKACGKITPLDALPADAQQAELARTGKTPETYDDNVKRLSRDGSYIPICPCNGQKMWIWCPHKPCRDTVNYIEPAKTAAVVIAGLKSTGKSTLLADLVDSDPKQTGLIVHPRSRALINWKEKVISEREDGMDIGNTRLGADNFGSVITVKPRGKNSSLCLTITDRPGEETADMKSMLAENYLLCANYLILLLDALSISGTAAALKEHGIESGSFSGSGLATVSHSTALDNLLAVLGSAGERNITKKMTFFIAVSKWDFVEAAEMNPLGFSIGCGGTDSSPVLDSSGKFDLKRFKENSAVIRQFLMDHGEDVLVEKAESEFKHVFYYAFSSVGSLPQTSGQTQETRNHVPRHLADPFYFIMHREKLM
ncbi:MAG: hypothetical protein IK130_11095 [Oscillospiraceae bacterium]|nr:hypothetical protein [Oscillospiraceae bacterium]